MAKKYLSFEETAEKLGISTEELTRVREAGELRGFADRGTWKFRLDDVEEFSRSRQADSDPEVPMYSEKKSPQGPESDSALAGDEDAVGEQPTEIRREVPAEESKLKEGTSDSDVRLVLDDSLKSQTGDSEPDLETTMEDSDSDVQLTDESEQLVDSGGDSNSDVKMAGADSDSDVRIAAEGEPESDSDSDVQLVGQEKAADSDSDVKLAPESEAGGPGSDSDVQLIAPDQTAQAKTESDSDVARVSDDRSALGESGADVEEGSSIVGDVSAVSSEEDSGITVKSDSGITLEGADDSGISLEADDSGISLDSGEDSGIALEEATDDSITLADDSGIALDAPSSDEEPGEAVPLLDQDVDADEETQLEVPSLHEGAGEPVDDTDTNVILFDDEEADDHGATVVKKSAEGETPSEEFAEVDEFGAEFADDDLEVAADVLGEDDELEAVDVFDAGDEDFDESFEVGESHAEFVAPMARAGVAPDIEEDWGTPVLAGLTASAVLMALCGMVMFDLVRSMWGWQQPFAFNSALLDQLRGLFGG